MSGFSGWPDVTGRPSVVIRNHGDGVELIVRATTVGEALTFAASLRGSAGAENVRRKPDRRKSGAARDALAMDLAQRVLGGEYGSANAAAAANWKGYPDKTCQKTMTTLLGNDIRAAMRKLESLEKKTSPKVI